MVNLTLRSGCVAVSVTMILLALSWSAAAGEASSSAVTEQVLDHHLKAFGDRDIDAILADYTEESVMLTPDGALKGHEQLRPAFEALFAEFAKPGATFEMKQRIVEGNVAYIFWSAETADNVYELGTDTFVIREGKIAAQSFTSKTVPKSN